MEIYVQSRGVSEKNGYCWLQIAENSQQRVDEPLPIKKFKDLLQTEAPSILLARENNQLLLLVTGIKASTRTDFMGRIIRNSVAWVGQKDDEDILRAIAIRALQSFRGEDSLKEEIDAAVKPDAEEGFQVNFDALKAQELAKIVEVENNDPDKTIEIGLSNSEENVTKLVKDLKECQLPDKQGPLVVFTGIKSQSALKEAGVWRGYSSLDDQKKIVRTGNGLESGTGQGNKRKNPLFILIISISLIALVVLVFIFQPWKEQPKPSEKEPKETPVQISPPKDSAEPKSFTTLPSPSLTTPQPIPSATTESKELQSEDSVVSKSPSILPSTSQPESQLILSPTSEQNEKQSQVKSKVNSTCLSNVEEENSSGELVNKCEETNSETEENAKMKEAEVSSGNT